MIQSWDTASKAGTANDFSVCTTWGISGERLYLLHVCRARLEFPALVRAVVDQADVHRPERVLIEDKNSGIALLQQLREDRFFKAEPYRPSRDKVTRLEGVTPMIEQGRLLLPTDASWRDDFVDELCGFPRTHFDDQVDATSQALEWMREQGNAGGLFHYMREEHHRKLAYQFDRTIQLRAPAGISHASTRDGSLIKIPSDRTIWVSEEDAGPLRLGGYLQLN